MNKALKPLSDWCTQILLYGGGKWSKSWVEGSVSILEEKAKGEERSRCNLALVKYRIKLHVSNNMNPKRILSPTSFHRLSFFPWVTGLTSTRHLLTEQKGCWCVYREQNRIAEKIRFGEDKRNRSKPKETTFCQGVVFPQGSPGFPSLYPAF
jgi:hypothetical protein